MACLALQYFPTLSHKSMARFWEKGVIENNICVLIFSTIFSAIFFIPRKVERDTIKMNIGRSIKYPLFLSYFKET